jgi:hypothetical protein
MEIPLLCFQKAIREESSSQTSNVRRDGFRSEPRIFHLFLGPVKSWFFDLPFLKNKQISALFCIFRIDCSYFVRYSNFELIREIPMNQIRVQRQAKWWCVSFGQETMDPSALRKLHFFLKRYTTHRVFGNQRIFLDMSESKGRHAFPLFQKKLTEVAENLGLNPESWQWGMGKTVGEAWVHARWRTLSLETLPIEAVLDYLNPLEYERVSVGQVRRIKQMRLRGIGSMQDLVDLPEEVLVAQGGVWVAEFAREHFERPEERREDCLERLTSASLHQSSRAFQLEDWIPEEYLQVG